MSEPASAAPALIARLGSPTHVGVVVRDLDRTMESMGAFAGGWQTGPPHEFEVRSGERRYAVSVERVFSTTGAVLVELIKAIPGSVWEPRESDYLHHFGYVVPRQEFALLSRELESLGAALEATRWHPSGEPVRWAYHRWPGGARLELIQDRS